MKCYYCSTEINKVNESVEHIIPNSIGGRLKSKGLLCKSCNSYLGSSIDAPMAERLNVLAGQLIIKREKGEVPHIRNVKSESGKVYHLENGRTPKLVAPIIDVSDQVIHISARDEKEMNNILNKLKKKYPEMDIGKLKGSMTWKNEYLNEYLSVDVSITTEVLRGVLKIAINSYLHKYKSIENVLGRIEDLKAEDVATRKAVAHYYPPNLMNEGDKGVYHRILIKGDAESHLLYAFVDIFSCYAFMIVLNENYKDGNVKWSYTFNVLDNKEENIAFDMPFDKEYIKSFTDKDTENITVRLARVLAIGGKRQVDLEASRISAAAVNDTLRKHPLGATITEDMLKEIAVEFVGRAVPFLKHITGKKNGDE